MSRWAHLRAVTAILTMLATLGVGWHAEAVPRDSGGHAQEAEARQADAVATGDGASTPRIGYRAFADVAGRAPGAVPFLKVVEGLPEAVTQHEPAPLGPVSEARALAWAMGKGDLPGRLHTRDHVYERWSKTFSMHGGLGNLRIGLGTIRGLMPASETRGHATIDLPKGRVRVELTGLSQPVDLWLVENGDGDGQTFLPDDGDRFVPLGRLTPPHEPSHDGRAMLEHEFGSELFRGVGIDALVVTPAGETPAGSLLLIGTPSSFERRFMQAWRMPEGSAVPPKATPDPRVMLGLVSQDVLDGGELFFRGTFDGNGRSCGTCHPAASNLVIDPIFVQALHIDDPDDPLFIADPGRPDHVPLEIPDLLDRFALIFENVDGFEDPANKFVMRSVPHNLSSGTALLPPDDSDGDGILDDGTTDDVFAFRAGWSGDGAPSPGSLRLFSAGAVVQHFTRDFDIRVPGPDSFRLQTDQELDKMEAFMLSTGRLNELDLDTVTLNDPGAQRGLELFTTGVGGAKCFACHNQAGGNAALGGNRNFNTGVELSRVPELTPRGIPCDGGFGGQGNVPANGPPCTDGRGDGTFNTPPLIEAADTGPFFHTNAFETIEDAVGFYQNSSFFFSPAGIELLNMFGEPIVFGPSGRDDIAAFLRVVNTSFNIQQALHRIYATLLIHRATVGSAAALNADLLALANNELSDALFNLAVRGLHFDAQIDLFRANRSLASAIASANPFERAQHASLAGFYASRANASLGTGMTFVMGEGNLVF